MPYASISELPGSVRNVLPKHAQEIYQKSFNSAYVEYAKPSERRTGSDREETAHKVAWSVVKKAGYSKGGDGNWHKKLSA